MSPSSGMSALLPRLRVGRLLRTCAATCAFHRHCGRSRLFSSRGLRHLEQRGLLAAVFPDDRWALQQCNVSRHSWTDEIGISLSISLEYFCHSGCTLLTHTAEYEFPSEW